MCLQGLGQACRQANLYAGALKTLGANKDVALPIKLFELSDVVLLAPDKEVGSKNQRQLVAVSCSKESGFEVIHGLLNRVMEVLGVPLKQGTRRCPCRCFHLVDLSLALLLMQGEPCAQSIHIMIQQCELPPLL